MVIAADLLHRLRAQQHHAAEPREHPAPGHALLLPGNHAQVERTLLVRATDKPERPRSLTPKVAGEQGEVRHAREQRAALPLVSIGAVVYERHVVRGRDEPCHLADAAGLQAQPPLDIFRRVLAQRLTQALHAARPFRDPLGVLEAPVEDRRAHAQQRLALQPQPRAERE